jgi:hypothetical protein
MITRERILRIAQELEDGGEGGVASGLRALAPRFPLAREVILKALANCTPPPGPLVKTSIVC